MYLFPVLPFSLLGLPLRCSLAGATFGKNAEHQRYGEEGAILSLCMCSDVSGDCLEELTRSGIFKFTIALTTRKFESSALEFVLHYLTVKSSSPAWWIQLFIVIVAISMK